MGPLFLKTIFGLIMYEELLYELYEHITNEFSKNYKHIQQKINIFPKIMNMIVIDNDYFQRIIEQIHRKKRFQMFFFK